MSSSQSESPISSTTASDYERDQNFNWITRALHGFRYKHLYAFISKLASSDKPIRILEIGAAHGKVFQALNDRFNIEYTGIEIEESFVTLAKERYGHCDNFQIHHADALDKLSLIQDHEYDVAISLETLEHIPEHNVVRLLEGLRDSQVKHFVFSVPVEIGPIIWIKNIGSYLMGYLRYKEYTPAQTFWAGLYALDRLPRHGLAHIGFDWRWLAQTVRHNLTITKIKRLPLPFLPTGLSTSIMIFAKRDDRL